MTTALSGPADGGVGWDIIPGSGGGFYRCRGEQSSRTGHVLDGRLDVRWFDGLGTAGGGFNPRRAAEQTQAAGQPAASAGQQVQGGWFDGLAGNADRRQALLDVLRHQGCRPGTQTPVAGDAREQGTMLTQAQGAQEVFVADEHQTEGWRVGQVEAQEQTHLFEAAGTEALGFIQEIGR